MLEIDLFKTFTIASPFIAAFLAALLSYTFSIKSKKFDILYQNKVPAFKEITSKVIQLKKYCFGRIAYLEGNEVSPYWEENFAALKNRTEIANVFEENSIFLSSTSRKTIQQLLDNLSGLCNLEIALASNQDVNGVEREYDRIAENCEIVINELYIDLNIKSFKFPKPNFKLAENYG